MLFRLLNFPHILLKTPYILFRDRLGYPIAPFCKRGYGTFYAVSTGGNHKYKFSILHTPPTPLDPIKNII